MKTMIEALITRLQDLVDDDTTPEANCSCHTRPPCQDCTDHAHRRELIDAAKRTLAQANEELPMLAELELHVDGVNPDGSPVGRSFKAYGYIDDLVAIRQRCELSFAPTTFDLAKWFDGWWNDDNRYRPTVRTAKEMCWEAVKAMSINMPHPVTGEVDVVRINERVAASFWAQLGFETTVDDAAVKRELTDYHFLLDQLPRIYMHVTGGRLSKTNYLAETIIYAHDDHVSSLVREELADAMVEVLRMALSRIDEAELDEAVIKAASEALGDAYDAGRVDKIIRAVVKAWLTGTIEAFKENQDEQG